MLSMQGQVRRDRTDSARLNLNLTSPGGGILRLRAGPGLRYESRQNLHDLVAIQGRKILIS